MIPEPVLAAYGVTPEAHVEQVRVGLINLTFRVDRGDGAIALQRLHPVFRGEVNLDIDALTTALAARGLVTPRLVRTGDGAPFIEREGVWRALRWVPGRTLTALPDAKTARSLGALVARFHDALSGVTHEFAFSRPGAHDTERHLAHLEAVLEAHAGHPLHARAAEVGEAILDAAHSLPPLPRDPKRIVHGDLKITNIVFDGEDALAIIDLDTLAHGTLGVEIGDALRSWCNRTSESDETATFDATIFEAAMSAYLRDATFVTREERESFVLGAETITLELASRFAADILEDRYWGWDRDRYPTRAAHNLARAKSQLAVARSIRAQRAALETVLAR